MEVGGGDCAEAGERTPLPLALPDPVWACPGCDLVVCVWPGAPFVTLCEELSKLLLEPPPPPAFEPGSLALALTALLGVASSPSPSASTSLPSFNTTVSSFLSACSKSMSVLEIRFDAVCCDDAELLDETGRRALTALRKAEGGVEVGELADELRK